MEGMTRRSLLAAAVLPCAVAILSAQPPSPQAQAPPATQPGLSTLRPSHPRLLVLDDDLPRVRALIAADPRVRHWRDRLRQRASQQLDEPIVARVLVGPRLLAQSRAALERITTLAGLYRLDRDPRALARAKAEMLAAAAFADWNPSHFLDVAEMTAALAIGYDWLYADLSPEDRLTIRQAIATKGLKPGLAAIGKKAWWAVEGRNNWTQVCLGGLALGALAVAEDEPALAAQVMTAVQGDGLAKRLRLYAPDGGDEEGPGYWDYATTYTVLLLAGLETALGNDLGIGAAPGLAATGLFRMHAIGPSGASFNYADARERPDGAPQMFWLAGRFDRPEYRAHERAWLQRSGASPNIFHLLWAPRVPTRDATPPDPSAVFRGVDVAFLGGDWRDPLATWVGVKGGRNAASHAHLDLGSFVVDALGERWAIDLGPDNYDLPEYFGRRRWTYFRLRTESHNTLVVNGGAQDPAASAPIVQFSNDSYKAFAVTDLTAAYAPALTSVRRGVALIDGRDVLIQDEIEGKGSPEVVWQMLTRAAVAAGAGRAVLRQNGRALVMRIVEPAATPIGAFPAKAPAPQAEQPGVTIVRALVPMRDERTRVVVWLTAGDRPPPPVTPLAEWGGALASR